CPRGRVELEEEIDEEKDQEDVERVDLGNDRLPPEIASGGEEKRGDEGRHAIPREPLGDEREHASRESAKERREQMDAKGDAPDGNPRERLPQETPERISGRMRHAKS